MLGKILAMPFWLKILILVIVILSVGKVSPVFLGKNSSGATYQTAKVQRDTLVVTVTGSGQVSTANSGTITTQASGVVKKIYVKNDQEVRSGDKLVDLELDQESKQKYTSALAAYQSAKNNYDNALATQYSLQSAMYTAWKTYTDIATNSTFQLSNGSANNSNRTLTEFTTVQDDWLAAEAKYKIQQNVIAQTNTALSSAWYSLQQISPVIYASISGKVTGLSLQEGTVINSTSSNSNTISTTSTSQKVASIKTDALPTVALNLTEIDVSKVKIGDKSTLTFDAFSGKTFTGKVISVDTVGNVSSGVTSYPTVIVLDENVDGLFSNMSAQASIITQTKDNVLVIPTGAVKTQNSESTVQVLKNGKPQNVTVETGISDSTNIEITSGLSENDEVIINYAPVTNTSQGTSTSRSPFSGLGGGGFGGGRGR